MSVLTLLPLVSSLFGPTPLEKSVQDCQQEQNTQLRLACYDALGRADGATRNASGDDGWRLRQDNVNGNLTLTRQAPPGAVFSIACQNEITHLRLRLTLPWEGENVTATVDGVPASGNWFVRDKGRLLEFGRGLPAIDEIRRWSGQHELMLTGDSGREIRVRLTGLSEAVKPLRQLCRW